jgi:hypothetical protein
MNFIKASIATVSFLVALAPQSTIAQVSEFSVSHDGGEFVQMQQPTQRILRPIPRQHQQVDYGVANNMMRTFCSHPELDADEVASCQSIVLDGLSQGASVSEISSATRYVIAAAIQSKRSSAIMNSILNRPATKY